MFAPEAFYTPAKRPSGHDISGSFGKDSGGAIPSNLLQIPNTESNGGYLSGCKLLSEVSCQVAGVFHQVPDHYSFLPSAHTHRADFVPCHLHEQFFPARYLRSRIQKNVQKNLCHLAMDLEAKNKCKVKLQLPVYICLSA